MIKALAAHEPRGALRPFEFDPGPLAEEQVEIKVSHCGMCHSDLSMRNNGWGMSRYPLVPGHEIVGTVTAAGRGAKRVKIGDSVGLGWYSGSCMTCGQCMRGDLNLCPTAVGPIVGRHGGFAFHVRDKWDWVILLPVAPNFA